VTIGNNVAAEILTEREGPCWVLTLSDPASRNALSPQVYAQGMAVLQQAQDDPGVRAVIVCGAGGNFCSGGDLKRIATARDRPRAAQAQAIDQFGAFIEALGAFPKPVIGAVEGVAAGGGMSLALACDLLVAAEDARFVMSYAKLGLTPDGAGSWHLVRALPRALALELMWLAEPVSANRLHALGVVNRLAPKGQSLAVARALAAQLAAMASNALASAKALVDQVPFNTRRDHQAAERDAFVDNLFHDNGAEGLSGFLEKRAPRFR
jgi:enoyl-CoA hydratase/carnithine racemase